MHPLFYHSPPPYTCTTYSVQIDTVKHAFSLYQSSGTPPPPEGRDQGVSPPNMSPPPLILLCHHVFSESATKRTVKKKKMEKRGKKDYRLAFRAPRGPLSSIRSERAANHQSCYFSLSLPLSLQGPLSMKRAI